MSAVEDPPGRAPGAVLALGLVMRLVAFAVFQGILALGFAIAGVADPWSASTAWWPLTATAGSVVTFAFLRWRATRESFSLTAFYRPIREGMRADLLFALGVAVVGGGLAVVGSVLLAPLFFSDPLAASALLSRPLPLWAAILAVVVFPVSVALTELPLYFGYLQPRLARRTGSAWIAALLPAFFLSVQHVTLPLVFDPAFMGWRAAMFAGFALVLALALWKRPRLLPYLIVVHFLLDLQAAITILLASM